MKVFKTIIIILILIVILFPIFWMISTSIKPKEELFSLPPTLIPLNPTMRNVLSVVKTPEIKRYFFNSVFITTITILLALFISILGGYSLSRFPLPGKNYFMVFILISQMFPWALLLVGIYFMLSNMHLLNSYFSLIIAYIALLTPVSIWLLKSYFDRIPTDFDEAAMIDGCTRFQALYKVVLPISKPGIISTGIYISLTAWNEYLFTFTLIEDNKFFTLPVGVDYLFRGEFSFAWDELMAASFLMSLPIIILFLVFQKGIIKGLTEGALK